VAAGVLKALSERYHSKGIFSGSTSSGQHLQLSPADIAIHDIYRILKGLEACLPPK